LTQPKKERKFRPKKIKFLTLSEKLEVLDEIDNGTPIADLAEKFEVSRSTIYDTYQRRFVLRNQKVTQLSYNKKVTKSTRYPQIDLELLMWCLKQNSFPLRNQLIADKARCIFDDFELKGNFNPTATWAKNFVLRHPELYERQGITVEDKNTEDETFQMIEEVEMSEENVYEEDQSDPIYYEEEYLIEEIEEPFSEPLEIETVDMKTEVPQNVVTIVKKNDDNCAEIPDTIALKSLKILIKYSEQRGHDEMLSQLIHYQSVLENDVAK
jgi:CENP-B N-terminal DNA-binding domain/Tc5 transposase DNA-binding domain